MVGLESVWFECPVGADTKVSRALSRLPAAHPMERDRPVPRDGEEVAETRYFLRAGAGSIFPVTVRMVRYRPLPLATDPSAPAPAVRVRVGLSGQDCAEATLMRVAHTLVSAGLPLGPACEDQDLWRRTAADGWPAVKADRVAAPSARGDHLVAAIAGQLALNRMAVLEGDRQTGVHQSRVALRRLRSLLPILRPLLPEPMSESLAYHARTLAAALGPARDWDVFVTESVPPVRAAADDLVGWSALLDSAEERRAAAAEAARRAMRGPVLAALAVELAFAARALALAEADLTNALWRRIRKRARALATLGPGLAELPDDDRHEVRKNLKKIRYLIEFTQNNPDSPRVSGFLSDVAVLQDKLGLLNDGAVVHALVRTVGAETPAAGAVVGWHAHAARRALPALATPWTRLISTRLPRVSGA